MSFRNIRLLALQLAFVGFAALVATLALDRLERISKLQARQSLESVLRTTQEAMQIWESLRTREVAEFAASPGVVVRIRNLLAARLVTDAEERTRRLELARREVRALIAPRLDKYGDRGFMVIDADYVTVGSSRDSNLDQPSVIAEQRRPYLEEAFKGNPTFVPPLLSEVPLENAQGRLRDRHPTAFLLSPVVIDGKVAAVLAIRIDPSKQFTRIAGLGRIGATGETYAFDREGRLITTSRFEQQLESAGLLPFGARSILRLRVADPGESIIDGEVPDTETATWPLTRMAERAVSGRSGFDTDGYRDYRGAEVFGAWLWDDNFGFGLATEMDVEEAMASYATTREILVWVLGTVVFLGIALSTGIALYHRRSRAALDEAYESLEHRVAERTAELEATRERLEKANADLEISATTDALTGIANRRHFDEHAESEWRRAHRERAPVSVLLLDIDYFKRFNDYYGHQAGDECLARVGALLAEAGGQRPGDIVARYGGEEFVALLPGASSRDAARLADNLRIAVSGADIDHAETQVEATQSVTISVGVATVQDVAKVDVEGALRMADAALYRAKAEGRNRVVTAMGDTPPPVEAPIRVAG